MTIWSRSRFLLLLVLIWLPNSIAVVHECVGAFKDGTCSKSCGNGQMVQTYQITRFPTGGGALCPFNDGMTQTAQCNQKPCPKNCVGTFVDGPCSATCGKGKVIQTYQISKLASDGGKPCPFADGATRTVLCNIATCPATKDCLGSFKEGTCSRSCGNGQMIQTYQVYKPAMAGGNGCPFPDGTTKTATCNSDPCPATYCTGFFCGHGLVLKSNPGAIRCARKVCTAIECCARIIYEDRDP